MGKEQPKSWSKVMPFCLIRKFESTYPSNPLHPPYPTTADNTDKNQSPPPHSFYSPRSSSGATTTEVLTNLPTFSDTEFGKHKILFLYSLPYHGPMKYECYILEYGVWVPCTYTLNTHTHTLHILFSVEHSTVEFYQCFTQDWGREYSGIIMLVYTREKGLLLFESSTIENFIMQWLKSVLRC